MCMFWNGPDGLGNILLVGTTDKSNESDVLCSRYSKNRVALTLAVALVLQFCMLRRNWLPAKCGVGSPLAVADEAGEAGQGSRILWAGGEMKCVF